jgi:branched-chain amino acid transport system substrate-binding protein
MLTALMGCGSRPAAEPIRVGHLVSLSGPDRLAGEHARQGVRQALADWREANPDAGGRPVQVVHVDTRGDSELAQAETVRLLTVNKVAALLAGPGAVAAGRILRADQPYGAPLIVPGELPATSPSSMVRILGAAPAARGRALARYVCRDLKAGKGLILTSSSDPVASAVATAFRSEWPASGGGSVDEWTFASDKDAASLIARASRARPEVILLACGPEVFRTIRDGLSTAGFKGPLVYGGEDAGPIAGLTDAAPEVYLATVYCPEKLSERGKLFAQRYDGEYHEAPDIHAAAAYDATWLVCDALSRTANPTMPALRSELSQLESVETVTGPVVWKADQTRRAFFLLSMHRQRRVVQTIEPDGP